MRFLYVLPYLRVYIPGRADLVSIMKEAIISTGKGKDRRVIDFQRGSKQEKAFCRVKSFLSRVRLSGGDPAVQYHLATDASNRGLGGVLFQISGVGTKASRKTRDPEKCCVDRNNVVENQATSEQD